MPATLPTLQDAQWDVLALLDFLACPVPMDILNALVPMELGAFIDAVNHAVAQGWVHKDHAHTLQPGEDTPPDIRIRFRERMTREKLLGFFQIVTEKRLEQRLDSCALANLLHGTGRTYDAAALLFEAARHAIEQGDMSKAHVLCTRVVQTLTGVELTLEEQPLFIQGILKLSRLSTLLGSNLDEPPALLRAALVSAETLGDRRSMAMIHLHAGVYAYLADDAACALRDFSTGIDIVESLGDEDIRNRTAEYRGIFYYIQGLYREAVEWFEKAMILKETSGKVLFNFAVPLFFGHSAALLGQFHRAIGVLDASWRQACMTGKKTQATLYQASLGIVLLRMGKSKEALEHILQARDDSIAQNNNRALYFAQRGILLYHHLEGHMEKVVEITQSIISTKKDDFTWPYGPQYTWPVFLEMNHKYHDLGYTTPQEHLAPQDMKKLIDGPNVNLRGAMLRIVALQKAASGGDPVEIEAMLRSSEANLLRSGDPKELAKTRIELARLKLRQHKKDEARELALLAWEGMNVFPLDNFPDDVKKLLIGVPLSPAVAAQGENVRGRFMDVLDEFMPSTDREDLLFRLVSGTCRFFGAEMGGLFWSAETKGRSSLVLCAGYNLTQREVERDDFRRRRELLAKALQNKEPLIFTSKDSGPAVPGESSEILCLPLEIRGHVQGALLYGNSYVQKNYRLLDRTLLLKIARHASSYIDRIEGYCRLIEEQSSRASGETKSAAGRYGLELIASSPVMCSMIEQVDEVARSGASVLILGETGVGKELLARRIHTVSDRADGPFVAIEFSSIPESLIESELFGHEKGAFTGSDRQKPGRIELANRGTLFIDEVGDISLSVQVKLLRTLQEQTFVRVGGTRTLTSDFRLVSATNRDLLQEVATGNFREDLYYRLNVVPFQIPPLRERSEDIMQLARHFLVLYARRYNKQGLAFSPEEESRIKAYRWPGNVRELQNIMERSVILSRNGDFELKLPGGIDTYALTGPSSVNTLDEVQRQHIKAVLELTGGKIDGPGGAAQLLGMKRTTLYGRMKKLKI